MKEITIKSLEDFRTKITDFSILKESISIYSRVSTKGQIDNFSIQNQVNEVRSIVKH